MQAKVGLTVEVVLHVLEAPLRLYRRLEEDYGLPGLYIDGGE